MSIAGFGVSSVLSKIHSESMSASFSGRAAIVATTLSVEDWTAAEFTVAPMKAVGDDFFV